jgi:hypothetical protein
MGLRRVQIWHFICDFVDRQERGCWAGRSESGGTRAQAVAVVQADGWSVTQRAGWTEVRCELHRGMRTLPMPDAYDRAMAVPVDMPKVDPRGFRPVGEPAPADPPAINLAIRQRRRRRK